MYILYLITILHSKTVNAPFVTQDKTITKAVDGPAFTCRYIAVRTHTRKAAQADTCPCFLSHLVLVIKSEVVV